MYNAKTLKLVLAHVIVFSRGSVTISTLHVVDCTSLAL